jgi:hypothetical protein
MRRLVLAGLVLATGPAAQLRPLPTRPPSITTDVARRIGIITAIRCWAAHVSNRGSSSRPSRRGPVPLGCDPGDTRTFLQRYRYWRVSSGGGLCVTLGAADALQAVRSQRASSRAVQLKPVTGPYALVGGVPRPPTPKAHMASAGGDLLCQIDPPRRPTLSQVTRAGSPDRRGRRCSPIFRLKAMPAQLEHAAAARTAIGLGL